MHQKTQQQSILCLDIGNTKIASSLIWLASHQDLEKLKTNPELRKWEIYHRVNLQNVQTAKEHLEQILKLVEKTLEGKNPAKIGISFGGPVDNHQRNLLSHIIQGWEEINLVQILSEKYACPVFMDNDANVATLGEFAFGRDRGQDMMYITCSTGIGGGIILNGKLWKGWQGLAGEVGHMLIDPNGPRWWGDRRGAVYTVSSGTYIAKRARRWLEDEPFQGEKMREAIGGDLEKITAKVVAEAADAGDKLAWESLRYSAWGVGVAIANTANILNLPLFIIGGSLIKSGENFWQHILDTAEKSKMPEVEFEVKKASLGDEAPLWGALVLTSA